MHPSLLEYLQCPSCRNAYEPRSVKRIDPFVSRAILSCPSCRVAVPVIEGFPLFGEARPWAPGSDEGWVDRLHRERFGDPAGYGAFLREKVLRGTSDLYAAFQPFNESTRALYPLLPLLRELLRPGDLILDTWCRTGWSGELLAGLFPEQRIVSLWEGDSNVLGYRGFAHWLGEGERLPNLDIVFAHPDEPLPLATHSVAVVHGLDALHRYRPSSFIPETLRVCRPDGLLVFPHIHLTNSQPDPFFERGCRQYHGSEWKTWLDALLAGTPRTGWVLPEVELFEAERPYALTDRSETPHYNGLVLIADRGHAGRQLAPCADLPLTPESYLVSNPLVTVDPHRCRAWMDPERLGGLASALLQRHPCYRARLSARTCEGLDGDEARLLWHASRALTLGAVAEAMQRPFDQVRGMAERLQGRELIHGGPVSRAMAALQHFYGFPAAVEEARADFSQLWEDALPRYGGRPMLHWLEDGSDLAAEDVQYLVDGTRCTLRASGLVAGARIAIAGDHHPGMLILSWAAWLQGVSTVLLDPTIPGPQLERLRTSCGADWLFTDSRALASASDARTVLFETIESTGDVAAFSDWIEPGLDGEVPAAEASPEAIAAVLFTSGSTGEPKGVMLSQRALCHSGLTMVQTFAWHEERLLSLGPLSMMSGLRNPAVASLVSGSTVLIPGRDTARLPTTAWEQCAQSGATVVTAVPVWLQRLLAIADRLVKPPMLRQILVTGTTLDPNMRATGSRRLGVPIGNYYGLTETGGICLASEDGEAESSGSVGRPAGALVQIVDAEGRPVEGNGQGLLRVHSEQLMTGYLDDPDATQRVLRQGWLLTGDLAHWDNAGHACLAGREDDLLKLRNGARFHPSELETLLLAQPGVEAAAATVLGPAQRLVALLVTRRDSLELYTALRDHLPSDRLPERLIRVDALPLGRNGKLVRRALPELARRAGEGDARTLPDHPLPMQKPPHDRP